MEQECERRMLWVRVFREGMTEMEGEGGMRDGCSG